MQKNPLPPQEELNRVLVYDPESGAITNRVRRSNRPAGSPAATFHPGDQYLVVKHKGVQYKAHRIAWVMLTGEDPGDMHVDHINGDRSDNRAENLRLATHSQNLQNSRGWCSNTSGHKGVYRAKNRWLAGYRCNRKFITVGIFDTFDEAVSAYRLAVDKVRGEFARHA